MNEEKRNEFCRELEAVGALEPQAAAELMKAANNGVELSFLEKRILELEKLPEKEQTDIRTMIADMGTAEKIKMAMLGDGVCRSLLVTDTNRLVQQAVMNNPRLQESEVENFAKNTNVAEFILRTIADNKAWMRSYAIKYNLVTNPKTPQDVSLKWMRYINKNDLRVLSKSKNVPQLISVTARKRLAEMEG